MYIYLGKAWVNLKSQLQSNICFEKLMFETNTGCNSTNKGYG